MDHSARVYNDILEMLPTEENPSPMVRLHRLVPKNGSELWAKLEWLNPFGSVKDRAAWAMVHDLEERGELGPAHPGRGLVEPTSGNTGISLAALAAVRGYPMRAVVPSKVPEEKKVLLKVLGADVDVVQDALCPLPGSEDGTIGLAKTYAKAQGHKYVMPNQYENYQNVEAHIRTTGPEIWNDTDGTADILVSGVGTGGTLTGVAEYIKSRKPSFKAIALEPTDSPVLSGGKPGPHKIQGIGAGFVPKILNTHLIDEVIQVSNDDAIAMARRLPLEEGLLGGISSGAAVHAAIRVARREENAGKLIVVIIPDFGERYISSVLFENLRNEAQQLKAEPIEAPVKV